MAHREGGFLSGAVAAVSDPFPVGVAVGCI